MDLSADQERLRRDLDLSAPASTADRLRAQLSAAQDSLRVAEEEIEAQQATIARLVESHRRLRLEQERTVAILPVPLVVTDLDGAIRSVNVAAGLLIGGQVEHLLGKPVFDLFAEFERGDLREMMASRGGQHPELRRAATVLPADGEPVSVVVVASPQLPGAAEEEISWVLLRRDHPDDVTIALAEALGPLAALPARGGRLEDALREAADACRRALRPAAEVTVALGPPLDPGAVASTAQLAQVWDGAQLGAGEGPSVTAYAEGRMVESRDASTDERWPTLRDRLPRGAGSVVAAPFGPGGRVAGVLSAYGCGPDAQVPSDVVDVLAVALGGMVRAFELAAQLARIEQDMERALASRSVIEQAKGVIMAHRGVDAQAAWEHLVHLSSTQHVKLREVAEAIVARARPER